MFTLDQIKTAHAKVKSGADFPQYIKDLKELGVISYSTFVSDCHTVYYGSNNYVITNDAKYSPLSIASNSNAMAFKTNLQRHQQGLTDYFTFCNDCAENGVVLWKVDLTIMTCTYYDNANNVVLQENIPSI